MDAEEHLGGIRLVVKRGRTKSFAFEISFLEKKSCGLHQQVLIHHRIAIPELKSLLPNKVRGISELWAAVRAEMK